MNLFIRLGLIVALLNANNNVKHIPSSLKHPTILLSRALISLLTLLGKNHSYISVFGHLIHRLFEFNTFFGGWWEKYEWFELSWFGIK